MNPINDTVGLLWTGNWYVCQVAIETMLRGGIVRPVPELLGLDAPTFVDASEGEVTNGGSEIRLLPEVNADDWRSLQRCGLINNIKSKKVKKKVIFIIKKNYRKLGR